MNLNNPITNPEQFRENIRIKLSSFFNKSSYSENLERGIYNWSLKEAKNRKIVKQWSNPYFARIYLDHLRSIYINLKNNRFLIELVETKKIKSTSGEITLTVSQSVSHSGEEMGVLEENLTKTLNTDVVSRTELTASEPICPDIRIYPARIRT